MRLTDRWMLIAIFTALFGCGDADVPPSEPDPGAEPAPTSPDSKSDSVDDTQAPDEPDDDDQTLAPEDAVMHTRVPGDILTRTTCNAICRQKDLFCDPEYHSFRGTGGGMAKWASVFEMLRCDEEPSEVNRDIAGNVWQLSEYECYCIPGS